MDWFVQLATTSGCPDDLQLSDEEITEARTDFIQRLLGKDGISKPSDVQTRWNELVRLYNLDGVEINADSARRTAWCEIDGLSGPGWTRYRENGQHIRCWELPRDLEGTKAKKLKDANAMQEAVNEPCWEFVARWECGIGPGTTCYVVHCRNQEESRDWEWRYLCCMGEYPARFFEGVVDMLKWSQSENEPDLENLEHYAGDIWEG